MKKIHQIGTLFALFCTLTICFPELIAVSAEGHRGHMSEMSTTHGRRKAVATRQSIIQYPKKRDLKAKQELLKQLKQAKRNLSEEIARSKRELQRLPRLSTATQDLVSRTEFMCVCPTPSEFLSVYGSLTSQDNFTEYEETSVDMIDGLMQELYSPNDVKQWKEHMKKAETELTQPICFFENEQKELLCLAWCGKGFEAATSFGLKSRIFGNLQHVLICGICGCADPETTPGTIVLSTEYVTLAGNGGDPLLAEPGRKTYIQGSTSYYTNPQFLCCNIENSFFDGLKQRLATSVMQALNFSFDFFVEDSVLASSIADRARKHGLVGCIDMEGVPLAKKFHERNCSVLSLRIVSDNAGPRTEKFSTPTGKKLALETLKECSDSAISFWMAHNLRRYNNFVRRISPDFPQDGSAIPTLNQRAKKRPVNQPDTVKPIPKKPAQEKPINRSFSTSVLPAPSPNLC